MKSKSSKIKLILIMVISMILLTGCVKQDYLISVEDDGQVLLNISVLVPNSIYDSMENYNLPIDIKTKYPEELKDIEPVFKKVANKYLDEGFSITPINDSFYTGFSAELNSKDVEAFNILLDKLYNDNLSGLQGALTESNKFFFKNYSFQGRLKYLIDDSIELEELDLDKLPFDPSEIFANVKIKLPGSFTSMSGYNEKDTDQNNAVFTADVKDEPINIEVSSKLNRENRMVIGITVLVIFLLVFGGRFISQMLRRRR